MKLKLIALTFLPFTFAACQTQNSLFVKPSHSSQVSEKIEIGLTSYQWQTNPHNAPKPITIKFTSDKRIFINANCNALSTTYNLNNNLLETSGIVSTRAGCHGIAAVQERFAHNLFWKKNIPFVLNLDDKTRPTLTLLQEDGEQIIFTGKK